MAEFQDAIAFISPLGIVIVMLILGFRFADRLASILDKHFDQLWSRIDRWLEGKENGRIS